MSCYEELIGKIREKSTPHEEVDPIMAWAIEALEKSNYRAYNEVEDKLTKLAYSIDRSQAENIVKSMKPRGQMWSYDQIKQYVATKGITTDLVDWYMVMNMCYNDYYNTAKMVDRANDEEFYFSLSKDFIEDPDAEPMKVAKYFLR